jgi:hypothetical protein
VQKETPTLSDFEILKSQVQRKAEWDELNDLNSDLLKSKERIQKLFEVNDEANTRFKNFQNKTN